MSAKGDTVRYVPDPNVEGSANTYLAGLKTCGHRHKKLEAAENCAKLKAEKGRKIGVEVRVTERRR